MVYHSLNNVLWIETLGDLPVIVLGDLNAKTGSENDGEASCNCETFSIFAPNDESGLDKSTMRVSKDKEINEFGKYLLKGTGPRRVGYK